MSFHAVDAKCIRKTCNNRAFARGLCRSCYAVASRLVQAGTVTWLWLEKNNRCLPRREGEVKQWFLNK